MIDSINIAVNSTPQKVTSRTTRAVDQVRSDEQTTGVLNHADKLDISGNLSLVQRRFDAAKMSAFDSHNTVAQAHQDLEEISGSLARMRELADQGSHRLNSDERAEIERDFDDHQARIADLAQHMPQVQQMVPSGQSHILESEHPASDLDLSVGSISSQAEADQARKAIESAIEQVENHKADLDRLTFQLNALTTRLSVASENLAASEATPEDIDRLEASNPQRAEVSGSEESYRDQTTQQIDRLVQDDVQVAVSAQANSESDKAQELLVEV